MGINFINYKYFSERYIIFESNEKGKEFDSILNKLLFVGEYLNGKRIGKGKEYYAGRIVILEDEYLNRKKVGKGKEYYATCGELIFEGEYVNGKRNGKGKEYNYGRIIFEGEYLYGKRNGKRKRI